MIDRDTIHAMVQFPASIILIMVGVVLLMIWRITRHKHIEANPQLKFLLGILLVLVGVKQIYWTTQGLLIAADLHAAAGLFSSNWAPVLMNGGIAALGLAMLAYLGSTTLGAYAYATACAVGGALAFLGWLLPRG